MAEGLVTVSLLVGCSVKLQLEQIHDRNKLCLCHSEPNAKNLQHGIKILRKLIMTGNDIDLSF